jgi:nucleotide-binding universal stress UspA family protein
MTKRVLVPVDGSPQSAAALEFTAEEWPGASVTLLHVIDPALASGVGRGVIPSGSEEWYQNAKARANGLFEEARDGIADDVTVSTRTEVGRPARTIVEVVRGDDFDHVVMGSHGREGVSRIILGSTAEYVVRRSPTPVTIVRRGRESNDSGGVSDSEGTSAGERGGERDEGDEGGADRIDEG